MTTRQPQVCTIDKIIKFHDTSRQCKLVLTILTNFPLNSCLIFLDIDYIQFYGNKLDIIFVGLATATYNDFLAFDIVHYRH